MQKQFFTAILLAGVSLGSLQAQNPFPLSVTGELSNSVFSQHIFLSGTTPNSEARIGFGTRLSDGSGHHTGMIKTVVPEEGGGHMVFQTREVGFNNLIERMRITNAGHVGIGTTNPRGQFDVAGEGDIFLANNTTVGTPQSIFIPGHVYFSPYNGTDWTYLQARRSDNSGSTNMMFRTWNAGETIESLVIRSSGNIGIGTLNPGSFKLAVEGKIGAREVLVTTAPWADFVFKPSYKLPTLSEVESYIQANGHLPAVPSEEQIAKEGNELAKTDAILLQKIEELTLYLIEMKKENEQMKKENAQMKKDIESLKCTGR